MNDVEALRRTLERALALAHAALEKPTPERLAEAQTIAHDALTLAGRRRPTPTTLADGHMLLARTSRLRTLLAVLRSAFVDGDDATLLPQRS